MGVVLALTVSSALAQDLFLRPSGKLPAANETDGREGSPGGLASSGNVVGIFYAGSTQWKCLDLPGGDTSNGNQLQLWDCNGYNNQKWIFAANAYKIVYADNPSKCIDVAGSWNDGA